MEEFHSLLVASTDNHTLPIRNSCMHRDTLTGSIMCARARFFSPQTIRLSPDLIGPIFPFSPSATSDGSMQLVGSIAILGPLSVLALVFNCDPFHHPFTISQTWMSSPHKPQAGSATQEAVSVRKQAIGCS